MRPDWIFRFSFTRNETQYSQLVGCCSCVSASWWSPSSQLPNYFGYCSKIRSYCIDNLSFWLHQSIVPHPCSTSNKSSAPNVQQTASLVTTLDLLAEKKCSQTYFVTAAYSRQCGRCKVSSRDFNPWGLVVISYHIHGIEVKSGPHTAAVFSFVRVANSDVTLLCSRFHFNLKDNMTGKEKKCEYELL